MQIDNINTGGQERCVKKHRNTGGQGRVCGRGRRAAHAAEAVRHIPRLLSLNTDSDEDMPEYL